LHIVLVARSKYYKPKLLVHAGSFSRSAVNHESGAKTGLSGIIMGIIIGGALLFMTPLFTDIPQVILIICHYGTFSLRLSFGTVFFIPF
jgi:hypothetical protein